MRNTVCICVIVTVDAAPAAPAGIVAVTWIVVVPEPGKVRAIF